MKLRITISFFFLFSLQCFSQVNLDSLWKIWNDPKKPDTAKLEAMSTISFDGYIYSNTDSAFYFATMQYNLAKKIGSKKYQGQALNTQGTTFYFKGDYAKAIDYFTKSLKIREEIGDKRGEASCVNNMGAIYIDQKQSDKALDCFKRSLKIREEIGDKDGMAASYNNIGAIYAEKKENTLAIECYTHSLSIREELGDKVGIATSYNNIGSIYDNLKDVKKAREYFNKGLKIREQIGDVRGQAISLYNIGRTYFNEGDFKTAIAFNEKGLKIAEKAEAVLHIYYLSLSLYECYKETGRYKEALKMQELYIKMNDSITSESSQKEVMKQEMQYSYEKQKAVDEKEHEKKIAVAVEQEKKQKIISYSIALGLIMVLIFAIFIFSRLQLTARQKVLIEHQKLLVEEKQKEILDSITYAKRLQDAILPPEHFVKEHLPESFILYKPKDIVAGDFYWMEVTSPSPSERGPGGEVIFIAAADCTGHGVPGAMVSVVCSNALNRAVLEFGISEPGKILDKTRELVLETFSRSDEDVKDGMDISLVSIIQTPNGKTDSPLITIKWAGANNSLLYISNKEMNEIKSDKQSIGKTENPQPFTTHTIQLQKGDSLFLFTDGYADQFGGDKGKKIKSTFLKELLVKNSTLQHTEQKEKLETAFENWKGNLEQVDDLCIIGIKL